MSTQLRFDIAGLCDAIASGDAVYRLALYTEHATVHVSDGDRPAQPRQLLRGKAEIAEWLRSTADPDVVYRVVNYEVRPESISLTTTCARPDGTAALYTTEADVAGGRIRREQIRIESSAVSLFAGATTAQRDAPPQMLDLDPSEGHQPVNGLRPDSSHTLQFSDSRSTPQMPRDVPSNFLG